MKLRIAEVFQRIRAVLHPSGGAAQKWGKSNAGIPSRKPITQEQVQEWRAQIENSDRFCDGDARGRDLSRFAWTSENFRNCDLRCADLSGCSLAEANFERAQLWNADLSGSDLTGVTNLFPEQLGATDLRGAKLPETLTKFEALEASAKLADNASKVFLTMLSAVAFTFLTISSTTDGQLITNYGTTNLPIIGTQVPILGFYCFMPIILLALFLYFHLYLQRLWEALATLPAYFPDGRRLDEKSHPWLLTDLARSHFPRLQEKSVALSFAQSNLSILLAYWVVPITLVAIWFRLLPLHYWNLITFHLLVLAVAIGFGLYCVANRWNAFHDLPARFGLMSRFVHLFSVGKGLPAGIVIGVAFLALSLLALMTYQRPQELRGISGLSKAPISVLSLNALGLRWPALSADYSDISGKPSNWTGLQDTQEEAQFRLIKPFRISGVHWAGITARNSFLAAAEFTNVRLPLADFSGSDFRDADLKNVIGWHGGYSHCTFADTPSQDAVEKASSDWPAPPLLTTVIFRAAILDTRNCRLSVSSIRT